LINATRRLNRKVIEFIDALLIWQYHHPGQFITWDQLRARLPNLIDHIPGDNTSETHITNARTTQHYYFGGAYQIEETWLDHDLGAIIRKARQVYKMRLTETNQGLRLENLEQVLKGLQPLQLERIRKSSAQKYIYRPPSPDLPTKEIQPQRQPKRKKYAWLLDPKDKRIKGLEPIQYVPICTQPKEGNSPRQCICGDHIPINWTLCPVCLKYYGADRKKWPPWLRKWVKINDAEVREQSTHLELEYIDEINYFDAGGGYKVKPKNNRYESERDAWNNYRNRPKSALDDDKLFNELSASDKALIYPGSYTKAAAGRSKYDKKELDQYSPQDQSAKIWGMQEEKPKATTANEDPNDFRNIAPIDKELDIYEAAEKLPDRERFIFQRYKTGYNQTETAALLGISQPMVSRIYRRAIKKIRNQGKP